MDDEAESDGEDDAENSQEDLDVDLEGFIDDSGDDTEINFDLRKKVEIEINRVALQKYLETQEKSALEDMGLSFIYSLPADLVK